MKKTIAKLTGMIGTITGPFVVLCGLHFMAAYYESAMLTLTFVAACLLFIAMICYDEFNNARGA